MIVNAIAISFLFAAIKSLVKTYDSNLIVFIYKSLILACVLPWALYKGFSSVSTNKIWLHALRGFLSVSGTLCFFYSFKFIPLANATVLGYLEQIMLVVIGMTYFKERATTVKIACVLLAFVGAYLIINPKYASQMVVNKGYLFVIIAVIFWTLNCVVIKIMGSTEKNKAQMLYGLCFQLLFAFPITFFNWSGASFAEVIDLSRISFSNQEMLILFALGVCYFIHSNCFYYAFKYGEMSVVIPFDYSRLIFTSLIAFFYFGEAPKEAAVEGFALILIASITLIKFEARYKKLASNKQTIQLDKELNNV